MQAQPSLGTALSQGHLPLQLYNPAPFSSETISSTSETTPSNPAVTWSAPRPPASLLRALQGQLAHLQGRAVVGTGTSSQGATGQWNVTMEGSGHGWAGSTGTTPILSLDARERL